MTPSFSTSTQLAPAAETTLVAPVDSTCSENTSGLEPKSAEPGKAGARTEPGPESAKLRTVRGLNGWTLYCIEDGDRCCGVAVLEQRTMLTDELLVGAWSLVEGEATVLRLELNGGASFTASFVSFIRESLADSAIRQLATLGVDAFVLE